MTREQKNQAVKLHKIFSKIGYFGLFIFVLTTAIDGVRVFVHNKDILGWPEFIAIFFTILLLCFVMVYETKINFYRFRLRDERDKNLFRMAMAAVQHNQFDKANIMYKVMSQKNYACKFFTKGFILNGMLNSTDNTYHIKAKEKLEYLMNLT